MELEMKISKKVMQRLLTALLAVALVLGCVNVPTEAAQGSAEPSAKAAEAAKVSAKEPTAKTSSNYIAYDLSVVEGCASVAVGGSSTLTFTNEKVNSMSYQWISFTPTESGRYQFQFNYTDKSAWKYFYANLYNKGKGLKYTTTGESEETEGLIYNLFVAQQYNDSSCLESATMSCMAGTTYYIRLYGVSASATSTDVAVTLAKGAEYSGINLVKSSKFFPYFRYDADSSVNGWVTARLSYTDGSLSDDLQTDNKGRSRWRNNLNYYDKYGYYLFLRFTGNETEKQDWRSKKPGNYSFELYVCEYEYDSEQGYYMMKEVGTKSITRTIISPSEALAAEGISAQAMSYGTAASVKSGLQAYTFTAQFDGYQVLSYSGDQDITVYAADNAKVSLKHGQNSVYGKFTKGQTYYVFVDADNTGSISLNYYNGATNPNAAAAAQQSAATTNPTQLTLNQTVTAQGGTYVVTSVGAVPTVTLTKAMAGKSISVPAQVNINGVNAIVTGIGANCFAKNKKLKSVTIPASVTSIGKNAFKGCKNLKKITLSAAKLKKIGKGAFAKINKKAVIKIKGKKKQKKALIKKIRKSKIAKSVKIR